MGQSARDTKQIQTKKQKKQNDMDFNVSLRARAHTTIAKRAVVEKLKDQTEFQKEQVDTAC